VSDWATVPSLWVQLGDAVPVGAEQGTRGVPGSRPPLDLDVWEIRAQIAEQTLMETRALGLSVRPDPPDGLRQLAVHIAAGDRGQVDWWCWRVRSWCRLARRALGSDVSPQPRRVRDTACPVCQAEHVTVPGAEGPQRVPALLIDLREGRVRGAECSACGQAWFRGEGLLELAGLLGTFARAVDADGDLAC
jgi:hypothetical protein